MHPQSKSVRIQTPLTDEMEHSTPVFLTSSFQFDTAEDMRDAFDDKNDHNIYSRYVNPTVSEFISKMCALEEMEDGFATASGMAAIFGTFMTLLSQGDHLVCSPAIFGSTHAIITRHLVRWGITCSFVDFSDLKAVENAITAKTKMVFFETPTNPGLAVYDLEKIGSICKKKNTLMVVDNCFATPVFQKPAEYGADIVIHSATKWIDGQGRVLGGIVLGNKELIREVYLFCRQTGPALSPFNAWVLSKSLETLFLRMKHHCDAALEIAEVLEGHPKLNSVRYPLLPSHPDYEIAKKQMKGGGGIIAIELKGGLKAGVKFMNNLKMLTLTSNLGDSRSIASHPASTTHHKLTREERAAVGISDGLIRLSIGLEYPEDIIKDILQALETV